MLCMIINKGADTIGPVGICSIWCGYTNKEK
jgi:hypothetical protein